MKPQLGVRTSQTKRRKQPTYSNRYGDTSTDVPQYKGYNQTYLWKFKQDQDEYKENEDKMKEVDKLIDDIKQNHTAQNEMIITKNQDGELRRSKSEYERKNLDVNINRLKKHKTEEETKDVQLTRVKSCYNVYPDRYQNGNSRFKTERSPNERKITRAKTGLGIKTDIDNRELKQRDNYELARTPTLTDGDVFKTS